jgi:hypothetical protein
MYYCDVLLHWVNMCGDFAPNFSDKRTGCCITTTHFLTREFFTKTTWLVLHSPYFSLFCWWKIKLKAPISTHWCDQGRIAGGAEHPHRIRLPGCI